MFPCSRGYSIRAYLDTISMILVVRTMYIRALLLVQKTSIRLETQVAKRTMGARIEKNNRVQKKKWQ